jgi:hypothetical protein
MSYPAITGSTYHRAGSVQASSTGAPAASGEWGMATSGMATF